jgi:hypothetical protein
VQILTICRNPVVYQATRTICNRVFAFVAPARSAEIEIQQCIEHEISSWVDCLTSQSVEEFCSSLHEASQLSFQSEIHLLRAWTKADLPKPIPRLSVSPILVAALSSLFGGSCSRDFSLLVGRVATKCLLFHHNPMPLAALISYFYEMQASKKTPDARDIVKENGCSPGQIENVVSSYAHSLVEFENVSDEERESRLLSLTTMFFSKKSYLRRLPLMLDGVIAQEPAVKILRNMTRDDVVAAVRQIIHMLAISDPKESLRRNCLPFLRLALPIVVDVSPSVFFGGYSTLPNLLLHLFSHLPFTFYPYR